MKKSYHFLDQHSAKSPDFMTILNDPSVLIVASDVYFTEFIRATATRLKKHLDELKKHSNRLFVAKSAGECVRYEINSLQRITKGRIIDQATTRFVRVRLLDTEEFAASLTNSDVQKEIQQERYSNPFMGQQFIQLTKEVQNRMSDISDYKRRPGEPLGEDDLKSIIRNARMSLANYLVGHNHDVQKAKTFALKDSYMLRSFCANLCRVVDWAHVKGIEGQGDEPMYNEFMDIEYVSVGSYFDRFLTLDKRNVRNDLNLRQLIKLLPRTRKIRSPDVVQ
jgi:hypothetical protein